MISIEDTAVIIAVLLDRHPELALEIKKRLSEERIAELFELRIF